MHEKKEQCNTTMTVLSNHLIFDVMCKLKSFTNDVVQYQQTDMVSKSDGEQFREGPHIGVMDICPHTFGYIVYDILQNVQNKVLNTKECNKLTHGFSDSSFPCIGMID